MELDFSSLNDFVAIQKILIALTQIIKTKRFKMESDEECCPLPQDLREIMWNFHLDLLFDCSVQLKNTDESDENNNVSLFDC